MKDRNGWDGKLRVDPSPATTSTTPTPTPPTPPANDDRRAVITNPEALEDPDYSDDEAPPADTISADEGSFLFS